MDPVTLKLSKNYTDKQLEQPKLKIAEIGKELSDFQKTLASVNVNQEAKQSVTGYGVISLPKNAANGQVSASVKGQSINQIIKNGDFSNGSTDWTIAGGASFDTVNKRVDFDVSQTVTLYQLNKFVPGKYVLLFNHTIKSGITGSLSILFRNGITNLEGFLYPVENGYIGTIVNLTSEADRFIIVRGSTGDRIFTIDNIMLIRISETEYENLTADEIKKRIPSYISSGAKSTISAGRLKSVGKNLFDGELEVGTYDYSTGNKVLNNVSVRNVNKIKVEPLQTYRISVNGEIKSVVSWFYDINSNFISYTTSSTINVPSNACYMNFRYLISDGITVSSSVMLNKGTTATPYEPYTESIAYIPNVGELRSVPNGTKDEVRVSGGKAEHIQRNKKKILQANDIVYVYAGFANVDVAITSALNDNSEWRANATEKNTSIDGYTEISAYHNKTTAYNYWTNSDNKLYIAVPKGTTLTQAKSLLTGLELTYQLAVPIEVPIEVSGTLLSYPSGTVYLEKCIADAGIYSGGISVLHQDLLIKEIEKLSKVDFVTGIETELNVSLAVIAGDKKSFTHPNLAKNDIVFFTYFFDKEGTEPEMTVEFYDSRYVLKDSVTGKYYKVVQTVANGVLSQTLVEV